MGLFSAKSSGNGSGSQSDRTAANINRAAKSAQRGGSAIRPAQKAAPAQHGRPSGR